MFQAGLVSVTFRSKSPQEIVELARRAGLECIEWGGDVHVPHGDLQRAREVRRLTGAAGLRVSSYGSYYRAWPEEPCPFEQVLETALELGAPLVRIWAGKTGSSGAPPEHYSRVAEQAHRAAELAAEAGAAVALEYHNDTLTDTIGSALALVKEVAHPNLGLYWQPRPELSVEQNLAALRALLPWLRCLHVFHWQVDAGHPGGYIRRPLAEGAAGWKQYLSAAAEGSEPLPASVPLPGLLEFVREDREDALLEDAASLKAWLGCTAG